MSAAFYLRRPGYLDLVLGQVKACVDSEYGISNAMPLDVVTSESLDNKKSPRAERQARQDDL